MSALDNFFSGMTELLNKYREQAGETADTVSSVDTPVALEEPKKEEPIETKQPEVNPLEAENKMLKEMLAQRDATILQNNEQINALKELTSVNNPVNNELSLEEIIIKGEF